MIHARHFVRSALMAALRGATSAGQRVLDDPTDPRVSFPAVVLDEISEQQREASFMGTDRLIERVLQIEVAGEVQQAGDWRAARDTLAAEIEAALTNAVIAGVKKIEPIGYMPETQAGERPLAVGRQRFAVTYTTAAKTPGVVAP